MSRYKFTLIAIGIILAVAAGSFYWKNLRGIWPLLKPVPERTDQTPAPILPPAPVPPTTSTSEETPQAPPAPKPAANTTGIPLKIPAGFSVSIFADELPGARVIVFDSLGNAWVSQPSEGTVSLLEMQSGKVARHNPVFKGLQKPHGLAFDPDNPFMLFIAEENKISRVNVYSEDGLHAVATLPSGGNHTSRTIAFGPDGRLYVAIGSTCNVCNEENKMRAKIFSMNKDGSDLKEFARGLRNSVFFTWHPETRAMWATEMGRDLLGDDIPPEEINIVGEGKNYGWPTCYGNNVHDTEFDKNTYIRNPCMEPFETPSFIDIQAHSAPLGLAFVTNPKWPTEYANDLLVAYHGSWNRTTPTGYKLVRIKLAADGSYQGVEDFISGWFANSKLYGRPVDLVFGPNGRLYLTDDRAGLVYAIEYAS